MRLLELEAWASISRICSGERVDWTERTRDSHAAGSAGAAAGAVVAPRAGSGAAAAAEEKMEENMWCVERVATLREL
jgi:hypothetical protein